MLYSHTMRKQGSCLEKEIMQGTMPGTHRRGRPCTAWMATSRRGQDSPWKSQSKWQRTGINGESTPMVWPTLGSRTAKEENRTVLTSRGLQHARGRRISLLLRASAGHSCVPARQSWATNTESTALLLLPTTMYRRLYTVRTYRSTTLQNLLSQKYSCLKFGF